MRLPLSSAATMPRGGARGKFGDTEGLGSYSLEAPPGASAFFAESSLVEVRSEGNSAHAYAHINFTRRGCFVRLFDECWLAALNRRA